MVGAMVERRVWRYRLDAKSPRSWLLAAGVATVGVALAVIFFTFFLALLAVGMVALPFVLWRKRKALAAEPPPRPETGPGDRKVIDADYEIR